MVPPAGRRGGSGRAPVPHAAEQARTRCLLLDAALILACTGHLGPVSLSRGRCPFKSAKSVATRLTSGPGVRTAVPLLFAAPAMRSRIATPDDEKKRLPLFAGGGRGGIGSPRPGQLLCPAQSKCFLPAGSRPGKGRYPRPWTCHRIRSHKMCCGSPSLLRVSRGSFWRLSARVSHTERGGSKLPTTAFVGGPCGVSPGVEARGAD
jgi:hypothetical protein